MRPHTNRSTHTSIRTQQIHTSLIRAASPKLEGVALYCPQTRRVTGKRDEGRMARIEWRTSGEREHVGHQQSVWVDHSCESRARRSENFAPWPRGSNTTLTHTRTHSGTHNRTHIAHTRRVLCKCELMTSRWAYLKRLI